MGFTDEEWDEVSQELPKPDDAVLKKYLEGRAGLIAQEHKQRSGNVNLFCRRE
jgi:adenosine deaminase CECR1